MRSQGQACVSTGEGDHDRGEGGSDQVLSSLSYQGDLFRIAFVSVVSIPNDNGL